jgi:hypothetical protein
VEQSEVKSLGDRRLLNVAASLQKRVAGARSPHKAQERKEDVETTKLIVLHR